MAKDLAETDGLSMDDLKARAKPAEGHPPPSKEEPAPEPPSDIARWSWLRGDGAWPEKAPPDPPWILRLPSSGTGPGGGVLPSGKVAVLASPGGTGKSFVLTALALAITTGRPWLKGPGLSQAWLDIYGGKGRVAVIFGEDDDNDVARRFYCQAQALGLSTEDRYESSNRLLALGGQGKRFQLINGEKAGYTHTDLQSKLTTFLEEEVQRNGEPFRAILFDPLARFSPPEGETDNHAATRLVEALEKLAHSDTLGRPLVMASHHTRKSTVDGSDPADRIRGASGLRDGVRWAAMLERRNTAKEFLPIGIDGVVEAECVKSNVGAWPEKILLGRVEGGALRGLSLAEEVKVRDAISAFGKDEKAQKKTVKTIKPDVHDP